MAITIMDYTNSNQENSLILALRITPKKIRIGWNKKHSKPKWRTLDAISVMNRHLELLDKGAKYVYYATDVPIDKSKIKQINNVIFFSYVEKIAVICDTKIFNKEIPFIPNDVTANNTPEEWLSEKVNTWIRIDGYRQIKYEELDNYTLLNDNKFHIKTLGSLLDVSKRPTSIYCKIDIKS